MNDRIKHLSLWCLTYRDNPHFGERARRLWPILRIARQGSDPTAYMVAMVCEEHELDEIDLADFVDSYVETLLWSESSEDGDSLSEEFGACDIELVSMLEIIDDCAGFLAECADKIGDRVADAGQDFALTRNGHGAGFWDGRWPEPEGADLTRAAKAYGTQGLMADGSEVYCHG